MVRRWLLYTALVCSVCLVQLPGRIEKLNARIAWVTAVIVCVCAHLILNPTHQHLTGMDTMAHLTEENRNKRRDKKRVSKMVIDNGGIRKLREARNTSRAKIALERQKPPKQGA